ncbi:DUF6531 domain-containing protein [Prevotella jejuni]
MAIEGNPLVLAERAFGDLFGKAKDSINNLQKDLASVLPSMPGMPVAKYFDLALGVDIHATTWPPSPALPVPACAMVFDLMSEIMSFVAPALPSPESGLGAIAVSILKGMAPSVKVHGRWIAQAGISMIQLPAVVIHIFPVTSPFADAEMWMGSSTVLADGGPCSTQFHPALSCSTFGFAPPPRLHPGKFKKPSVSRFLPTQLLSIITSGGNPVLVGGPPTIDLFQLAMKMGLKCLTKTKAYQKLSEAFEKTPLGKINKKMNCCLFGEPVDAATGRVYHTNTDFELSGPIPLVWERTYYSDVDVPGALGYNWHHSYNMSIREEAGLGMIFRHPTGRETGCPYLQTGESFYDREEHLEWKHTEDGYTIYNDDEGVYYHFASVQRAGGFRMLTEISTADGFKILFRYTTKGALKEIVDSRGETLYVNTDCQGRVEKIFRRANSKDIPLVGYHYDSSGNMISTEDSSGTRKFFYYVGHQLVKLSNQSGMSFHWEYDGEGEASRCIHTWGDDGVMEYYIEYGDGFTRTTNGLGHTTEYYYHDNKLIYKIVDANGGITHQHYNEFKELDVVVNPEGYSRRTVFNNFGLPVEITDENGAKTRLAYDGRRNLTSVITSTGRRTSWEYDEYDRVIKRTLPDGNSFSYTYEGGALKTITDMEGRIYTLKFNNRQELQQLVFPNGIHRSWEYDERGRLVKATDVKGNVTSYSYDDADNLIRLHEPDGNVHEFSYDTSGNLIVASDRLRKVEFEYGPLGTLIGRRQLDHHVRFRYDGELQLREIINEGGECYSFRLDGLGRVVEETGFDGLQRKYLRDGAGRVVRVIRPEGRQTDYEYDGVGNILQETQHDGRTSRFAYDEDGRLLRAENKEIKVAFKHDLGGRIVKETQGGHCIMRKYDRTGRHVHTESSLGASIDYSHDKDGNLSEMNSGGWSARWQRDRVGLETERELTGGVHVKTHHDSLGRETYKSVGARNVEQFRRSYTWGIGNRLHATEDGLTGRRVRYDYDEFDNLLSAEYKQGNDVERIYRIPDRIGNLFETREKDDRKYGAGSRLAEDRDYFYHYDCEGNLVFKEFRTLDWAGVSVPLGVQKAHLEEELGITFRAFGAGWRYDWQSDGMLSRVVRPDGKEVSFAYDALGRRTEKTYEGVATHFVWDGNVPLHEWQEVSSNAEKTNITTWLFEQNTFIPAAKLAANGESFSIVSDYLGTPMQAYDKEGNKVWEQELDIYGRQRKRPSAFIPFKYQGQYEDAETGLYYNRFRYYDPNGGSYISQDPIGLAGGNPTLYAYVSDVNCWNDVLGLTAEVYKLVATKDGYYDVYEWGNDKPVGKTYLKEGDTWKIGETTNFRTRKDGTEIQNRYTKKWLDKNNLEYKRLQYSPNKSAKVPFQNYETSRIKKFEKRFGKKPAGNKCFH